MNPPARPRGHLAVMACLTIFSLTQGVSYPLLALVLQQQGEGETAIGVSAAMTALGVLVAGLLVPPMMQRFGARSTVLAASAVGAVMWIGFAAFPGYWPWLGMRLVLGTCAGIAYVVGELWLIQVVKPESRGRTVGLYGAVLSIGFAAGPLLLSVTGTTGWAPYLIGAVGCAVTFVLVHWLSGGLPDKVPPAPAGTPRVWRQLWILVVVVGGIAFFDQAVLSLVPVYGLQRGLSEADAALLVGVMIVGNIVMQMPLGHLADRIGPPLVMAGACLTAAVLALFLPGTIAQSWLAWPLLFLWGGVGFGIYMLALTDLGRRFSDDRLVSGSAAYAMAWGFGGLIGPGANGAVMEWGGPDGLFWLSAGLLTLLGLLLLSERRRPAG